MYSPAKSSAQSVVLRLLCLNVILACSPGLSASSAETTQSLNASTASNLVKHFYSLLDINRYKEGILDDVVTKDFQIFESRRIMDLASFHDYLTHTDPNADPLVKTSWTLTDFRISLDSHSAHLSYQNHGEFTHGRSMNVSIKWMESAYITLENSKPKIKFINVNLISKKVDKLSS